MFPNEQLASGGTVYVAIDRTTWRDINLLMASVVWKGRAIPLYWQRLKTLGNSHYDEQTAFLSIALPKLADYRVVVLGDREFCSVDLARWLGQQGHYFCLRQKKSTFVSIYDLSGNLLHKFEGGFRKITPDEQYLITFSFEQDKSRLYSLSGDLIRELEGGFADLTPDDLQVITSSMNENRSKLYDLSGNLVNEFEGEFAEQPGFIN